MDEQNTYTQGKTIKVTMPRSYANLFIEECRLSFSDSRWLKIKFDDMMYKALYMAQPEDIKANIEEVRKELVELVQSMYKTQKWGK